MAFGGRLRVSIMQRGKALALLARGYSIDRTTKYLREKYHSNRKREEVQRAYFPPRGWSNVSSLEGKLRSEIAARFSKLVETHKKVANRGGGNTPSSFSEPRL